MQMLTFSDLLEGLMNIKLSNEQKLQFETYYETLIAYNKHTNLTTITEPKDFIIKHLLDSIWILERRSFKNQIQVADIGTGAGFPGIPLKIINPSMKLTLIDSNGKKIKFLNEVIHKIGINVEVVYERAEMYAKSHQEKFDVIVSRAVAELSELIEIVVPMLKVGGSFYAYKGSDVTEEILRANHAMKVLHAKKTNIYEHMLPNNKGKRTIIKVVKNKHIEGYPRTFQQIKKKGL